jgi:hypothetical protein
MNKLDNVGMGSHCTMTYMKAIYGAVGAVQISENGPHVERRESKNWEAVLVSSMAPS